MKKTLCVILAALVLAAAGLAHAVAAPAAPPAKAGAGNSALQPYDKFTDGATAQRGLFTIWRKDGNVSFELKPDQLDKDFVELGVPVNGVGSGLGTFFSGITDLQNCRIIRFVRQDDKIAIVFPPTRFTAAPGSPEARAAQLGEPNSVAGIAKIQSIDDKTGDVVFDAAPFLQDLTDVADYLSAINGAHPLTLNPMGTYRLDSQSSYFGTTKSFPDNVVITATQTFDTSNPEFIDTAADARNIQIDLQYDIATLPADDGYMPRLYDDRVGYFVNAHANFSGDDTFDKDANYIVRWNVQPSDPSKAVSPAKTPIVYYLSNTIPVRYRPAIRKALLTWNKAFLPLGISDAVEVKDQPTDPSFDPDDIRYSVIRWLAESQGGFAEAQLLYNPYNGEMIKSGVVIDSDLMRFGKFQYPVLVAPAHAAGSDARASTMLGGASYLAGERQQFGYGLAALSVEGLTNGYYIPDQFADEFLESIVLHKSGHDFGLRHNFIGSQAYTAKDLQSSAFTSRYGVASSVMEYSPINIWPKGTPQGDYFQTALGPYDYYVIHWGYARIPGAKAPQDERATLDKWASQWANPKLSWSSDEDVDWFSGAAIDPRNQQWDLTDDNIGWCGTQMSMARSLIGRVDTRFPRTEGSYDDLRAAFGMLANQYGLCGIIVSRYLGGEYVSRDLRGDPHAKLPLSPIPKSTQIRAFKVLEANVFSSKAWNFSPVLLRELVTQYRYDDWEGNMPGRHDVAIEDLAATYQAAVVARMFAPVTLQRLDDMQFKYPRKATMGITDLFTWMQSAVYGDLSHLNGGDIPLIRRDLQRNYAAQLSRLANTPADGAPQDAQSLARFELTSLNGSLEKALKNPHLNLLTRAHLSSLNEDVERALHAQDVIPPTSGA